MTKELKLETIISNDIKDIKIQTLLLINSDLNARFEEIITLAENQAQHIKELETELKRLENPTVH